METELRDLIEKIKELGIPDDLGDVPGENKNDHVPYYFYKIIIKNCCLIYIQFNLIHKFKKNIMIKSSSNRSPRPRVKEIDFDVLNNKNKKRILLALESMIIKNV